MVPRNQMKKNARQVLRKHYWLLVMLCLFAAVIGTEFASSLSSVKSFISERDGASAGVSSVGTTGIRQVFTEILYDIVSGNEAEGRKVSEEITEKHIEETKAEPDTAFGRSRGVFSYIINQVTSGSILISLAVGLKTIIGSANIAVIILILLSLLLLFAIWTFGLNLYQAVMRRMFLEGRCYDKVHKQRLFFLLKAHKWLRAGMTLLVMSVYQFLWSLTIIGGVVKRYAYYLVPYIVAENPCMNAKEAITLSRNLMKGHKWECFIFELSFIGWSILGYLTLGLSSIFYTNPYKIAAFSEYYACLRRIGKENSVPYAELLNDRYMFEHAADAQLADAYKDIIEESKKPDAVQAQFKGVRKWISDIFGLTFRQDEKEKAYEVCQARKISIASGLEALEGIAYPVRLSPIPERSKRKWIENVHYIRNYSIWSVIMIFFMMSFVGWIWEVSLHLISDGTFVNRGVLHGPWLPIYGAGSVLILLLLNKFRKNPALEFILAVVVCGIVEYFTSYYLEIAHDGKKWWDYSGYFLNLNGRICAEGLLTFGIGGMAIVYVLAPLLDNLIRRIPYKILIVLCVLFVCIFTADQIYSKKYPNEGKGITDYTGAWLEPDYKENVV